MADLSPGGRLPLLFFGMLSLLGGPACMGR